MLIVVHYCYRFLCTVVTDSCALLLLFSVHSIYHFLCTRRFCLQMVKQSKLDEMAVDMIQTEFDRLSGRHILSKEL